MSYTVGRVAELAGVTVRTLHHYDEIGLLSPGERGANGYRRYTDADLERLQQVLYYRELGFALDEIAAVLDDPDADPLAHLRRQHRLLRGRIERLSKMLAAVEYAMEAHQMDMALTPEERFEVFGDHDPSQYGAEVEERWGNTEAFKESRRRVSGYSKADWLRMKEEGELAIRALASAKTGGLSADSPPAMEAAEAHRRHISKWFYDCSFEAHRGLGEMYVADERFGAVYEDVTPGLAAYARDAILANAARHGA